MWLYYRDRYYNRREAIEQFDPKLLRHPVISLALTQIDLANAAIDNIMALHTTKTEED